MKQLGLLLVSLTFLVGCTPASPVSYIITLTGTPGSGFSAFYRVGSGSEIAIPSSLPQTIDLPNQPAGTAVSARVRLVSQGNVVLTITANGAVCRTSNPVNSGAPGETTEAMVSCTR
jgi:hypothetical protein